MQGYLVKQYDAKEQAELRVRVQVPGAWFGGLHYNWQYEFMRPSVEEIVAAYKVAHGVMPKEDDLEPDSDAEEDEDEGEAEGEGEDEAGAASS